MSVSLGEKAMSAMPPHPHLDALLHEITVLLGWWVSGSWWHSVLLMAVVYLACALFFKGLASADEEKVRAIVKGMKTRGELK